MPGLPKNVLVLKIIPILSRALCPLLDSTSRDSAPRGALTSSHQEYQTSPQLWWAFCWKWKKEKCTHQLCSRVLDVPAYILRLFCLKAKLIFLSFSVQAQKSIFFFFFFFHRLWIRSTEKIILHITKLKMPLCFCIPQHRLSNCLRPENSYLCIPRFWIRIFHLEFVCGNNTKVVKYLLQIKSCPRLHSSDCNTASSW